MGKGDKKTKRGKIFMGSYGVTRRRKKKKSILLINKKKDVTAKSTTPEKVVGVKKDDSTPLSMTKKPERSGAEGTSPKKTQAKSGLRLPKAATPAEGGAKKTASKKTSTLRQTQDKQKKATPARSALPTGQAVKKAATKKTSAKK